MFIIELPQDNYGHTMLPRCVMEVDEVEQKGFDYSIFKVLAPQHIAQKWPRRDPQAFPYVEVSGPARDLSNEEWVALIEEATEKGNIPNTSFRTAARASIGIRG